MCQERAISTVTSIAVGTYGVHFGGIMHILSTGRYSLCAEMAINIRAQYRQVLAAYRNGNKRTKRVPAAVGWTWSGAYVATL